MMGSARERALIDARLPEKGESAHAVACSSARVPRREISPPSDIINSLGHAVCSVMAHRIEDRVAHDAASATTTKPAQELVANRCKRCHDALTYGDDRPRRKCDMILLEVTFKVPDAHLADFATAAREVARGSNTETGCGKYVFSVDLDVRSTFYLLEEWQSEAALKAHYQTPHFLKFAAYLKLISCERTRQARSGDLQAWHM
jgi:quinol monooxygenase YgiN